MSGKEIYCISKEQLEELYVRQGKSLLECANILGCGWWPVWDRLKKHGIKRRPFVNTKSNKTSFKVGQTTGEKNGRWNGGRIIHSGYVLIKDITHPFCSIRGYVKEHRLVVEKSIGRYLTREEQVHHINRNKLDNRIENLMLFESNSAHRKYEAKEFGFERIKNEKRNCLLCGKEFMVKPAMKKKLCSNKCSAIYQWGKDGARRKSSIL